MEFFLAVAQNIFRVFAGEKGASATGRSACVSRISSNMRWIPEWVRKGTRRNAIFPGHTLKHRLVDQPSRQARLRTKDPVDRYIVTTIASLRRAVTSIVLFPAPWKNESSEFVESLISMEPSHQSQARCRATYTACRIMRCKGRTRPRSSLLSRRVKAIRVLEFPS